ncbi:hypothetical protein [Zobellia amurskyensis]|uniref:hypothetical protein n=1 Tax=Zobellia amurskyensis TaxID=248905 RepID=UPI0012D872C3|nr:hypothetical protein [Zobellia amurskyensis]
MKLNNLTIAPKMDFNANAYVVFAGLKLESEPFYERVQLIEPYNEQWNKIRF